MIRYEAIGCGVYEVDPTAKPGDVRDDFLAECFTEDDATRIANSLNGSEALVEALRAMYDECHSESPEATKAFSKARAALAARNGETK